MNAISINSAAPSLFTRFLWKEYRMLRGFWLAGFAIAFLIQWFFSTVINHGAPIPDVVFLIAWGAAALYSVGAAITLFAAETEERTRDFLRLLPGDWKPMFASKVTLAAISTLMLGLALSLTGAWLEGWPTGRDAQIALGLGVVGVAVIEGFCWGLLFSLWWRQPLLAAVAAMACGSLGAQLAISFGTDSQETWTAQAYANAAPARLLICLGVFAGAVLLGRRWFYPQSPASEQPHILDQVSTSAIGRQAKTRLPRLKMFSRLLWQTWRESWRSMLVGIVLGFTMFILLMVPEDFIPGFRGYWMLLMSLVPVAILGALVFRPDQQREHRLFVATHAIPPRRMWFARQVVWLTLIVVLGLGINALTSWGMRNEVRDGLLNYLHGTWGYNDLLGREFMNYDSPWTQWWRYERGYELYNQGVLGAWCAVIAAYGVGQLCSMLLRQSLLAGFLAILLSIVIAGWALLMFLWQMPPLVYVLPIGVAALLATWLRTPSWVIGRTGLRHWLLPAAVIIVPLAGIIFTVPGVRLRQLEIPEPEYPFLKEPFAQMAGNYRARFEDRKKLVLEAIELSNKVDWLRLEEIIVEGKTLPEYGINRQYYDDFHWGNDPSIPTETQDLLNRFDTKLSRLRAEQNQVQILELIELTQQPEFSTADLWGHYSLAELLQDDAARLTAEGDLAAAFERLKVLTRFDRSIHYNELPYHEAILSWAQHPDQTSEQLKSAIADLQQVFQSVPLPSERILADYWRSHDVISGRADPSGSPSAQLLLSNRLPGEQERGLVALDRLTAQVLNYTDAVVHLARGGTARRETNAETVDNPRELIRMAPWWELYAIHPIAFNGQWNSFLNANRLTDAAATSFFASRIFDDSGNLRERLRHWVDAETRRRATLIQLALLAYRVDHDEYPESLNDLKEYWPTMLPWNVNDPYSNKPFKYHVNGLEHPLKLPGENTIPPRIPLLWSVGSANWKLMETFEYDPNPAIGDSNDRESTGQTVFKFLPQETDGIYFENLVFQLPN
jgi:hypothetical protein